MNNVGEKYLPIGTVVMLKGGTKRVMITGFCSVAKENQNKMYDYSGCMFPEGILSSDKTALFDHEQIAQVYHLGLVDDEETKFKTALKTLMEKTNNTMLNSMVNSSVANSATIEQNTQMSSQNPTPNTQNLQQQPQVFNQSQQ